MHFLSKKNFKIAPTPNRLTKSHKNLGEANYRFLLLAYQFFLKSAQKKPSYGRLKSGYVFQKNTIFGFWPKKLKK